MWLLLLKTPRASASDIRRAQPEGVLQAREPVRLKRPLSGEAEQAQELSQPQRARKPHAGTLRAASQPWRGRGPQTTSSGRLAKQARAV